MADAYTEHFNLTKPEVGASRDVWGNKLNDDLDLIDGALFSMMTKAGATADDLLIIHGASPALYLQDTDEKGAAILTQFNLLRFYSTPVDDRTGEAIRLTVNLSNGDLIVPGTIYGEGGRTVLKSDTPSIQFIDINEKGAVLTVGGNYFQIWDTAPNSGSGINVKFNVNLANGDVNIFHDLNVANIVRASGGSIIVTTPNPGGGAQIQLVDNGGNSRYLHNNTGTIGFLNNGGGWNFRVEDSGNMWSASYGWLHDYVNSVGYNQANVAANSRVDGVAWGSPGEFGVGIAGDFGGGANYALQGMRTNAYAGWTIGRYRFLYQHSANSGWQTCGNIS